VQCCDPFVCLSVSPIPKLINGAFYRYVYCRTLIGNPVLEVEPTGQYGHRNWPTWAGEYRYAAISAVLCYCCCSYEVVPSSFLACACVASAFTVELC